MPSQQPEVVTAEVAGESAGLFTWKVEAQQQVLVSGLPFLGFMELTIHL